MKLNKKIAVVMSAFMLVQPVIFADAALNKEIAALEMELVKINTKTGDYADMSEAQLAKAKEKTKKTLKKKKAKAKKEAEKDINNVKKDVKKTGKDLKDAGKEVGNDLKDVGKDIGNTFKNMFN